MPHSCLIAFCAASFGADVLAPQVYSVGVSKVDVTPSYPVRLHGFGFRRTESEGVKQRIWVKALAIGDKDPFVLVTADNLGVPRRMTESVAAKLAPNGVARERLCICATHTHTAPMLVGIAPTIFGMDLKPEEQAHVEQYTKEFEQAVVRAAEAALADRKPSILTWGVGSLGFSINRRTKGGPVDHDLPAMFIKDQSGKVRATLSSYACHCVTLSFNQISGDWAGCAAELIETMFPGSVALLAVGCGADSNPSTGVTGANWAAAEQQGREYAAEIKRLSNGYLAPLMGSMSAQCKRLSLPLADLPTTEQWAKKAAEKGAVSHHARVQQKRLAAGAPLKTAVDYEVCAWKWGDQLTIAFLPGEVVVDYSLRLKKELDARRLWLNAYTNDDPCYIPSERVLKEGGYEGEFAMVYYDLPTKFRAGLEQPIVDAVKECAGESMRAPFDSRKVQTAPRSPQQSLSSIKVGKDFEVDLVAAEPLVIDPVAIAFGPDGRLWVAEMNDYPSGQSPREPGGRIRVLEATNKDGVFDKATTFLSGIPFPTGVTVWRNGVLVCAAPDILYAEDTDGDGKADKVRKLFTGFATHNFQARVNSLEYGLDGWVYGSCGLTGGDIRNERGQVVRLGRRDFRCKPDEGIIEPAAGSTQQGRVRNDFGDWFGCDNTNLAWHYPLPIERMARNPHTTLPVNRVFVPDPAASKLFPASAMQMFALSGAIGNATAACGIGIYRDLRWGIEYWNNLYTCEPVHNAVHRIQLEPQGSTYVGRRPAEEANREFMAAADPWMRPVQVRTGTDGALWVVDMYRYVIEHPMWIPPEERAKHDLRAGSTMGRLYRIRKRGQPATALPSWSSRDAASMIANDNGAIRDLAMQQLLWDDRKDVAPSLRLLAGTTHVPVQGMQALCTVAALGEFGLLRDRAKEGGMALVDRHLVRFLSEAFADSPETLPALLKAATKTQPYLVSGPLLIEVAVSLGKIKGDAAAEGLVRLALRPDADQFLRAAVLSSITAGNAAKATERALALNAPPDFVRALVASAVGYGRESQLGFLAKLDDSSGANTFAALEGLLQGLKRKRQPSAVSGLPAAMKYAVETACDSKGAVDRRVGCIRLFGHLPATCDLESNALAKLLRTEEPAAVKSAAIEAAGRIGSTTALKALVANWTRLSPMQRRATLDVLLQTSSGIEVLMTVLESKIVPAAELDAARRNRLLQQSPTNFRDRAAKIFESLLKNRDVALAAYKSVDHQHGDAARGKAVFAKNCAGCHRLDDVGFAVGPDLATVALKPPAYLLMEILDPNRNLDARYIGYNVLTADGRTLSGLLAGETDSSISLLGQDGKQMDLLRSDIERIAATGKSLMPEGLEQQIPPAQMSDLLAYLRHRLPPAKSFNGNTPKLIAMEDGHYALVARLAELRGPSIQFTVPQFAIEYWQSLEDFAAWNVDGAKPGRYRVEFEYGCPDSAAGNAFLLESDGDRLSGKIASTGGWETYKRTPVGELKLNGGRNRITMKPSGPGLKEALMDLRAIYLTPLPSR